MTRPVRPKSMLREDQRFIVDQIKEKDGCMIVLGMGGGKTASTLTAITELSEIQRWLVIAPLRVARDTWPDEVGDWEHLKDLDYAVCVGAPEARRYALSKNAKVTIINRENLVWLAKELGSVDNWPWDGLVIDESSMFKAGKKRTTKTKRKRKDGTVVASKGGKQTAFGILATARKKVKKVVELTGTPGELIDLWGQIYLIDQGKRLGATREDYIARWFDYNQYSREIKPRSYAHDEIMERLKDVMISIPPRKLVEDPVHIPVKVQLEPDVMKEYHRFRRTLVSELHDVEAVNSGVLTNKLLQFCISKGTLVVTKSGLKPIEDVVSSDFVWDGIEWVSCKGSVNNGVRATIQCWGVEMTPDHKVLTSEGWREAQEICDGYASGRFDRDAVRLPEGFGAPWHVQNWKKGDMEGAMCLRERDNSPKSEFAVEASPSNEIMRLQTRRGYFKGNRRSYDDRHTTIQNLVSNEKSLSKPGAQGLPELGRPGYRYARRVVQFISNLLAGCSERVRRSLVHRSPRQQCVVQQRKLSVGGCGDAGEQSSEYDFHKYTMGKNASGASSTKGRFETYYREQAVPEGLSRRLDSGSRWNEVYDLIECGPRNRFVVIGLDGPIVVHNCGGSMYREDRSIAEVHTAKLDALDDLIEQANGEPVLIFYGFQFSKEQILKRHPDAVVFNESDTAIKDWNEGRITKLLMHPKSGGHGTNLQYGGHIAIWFDLTWSLELYLQANARLPRPGQQNIVAIYKILAEGTVDERVISALDNKETNQRAIIEAVEAEITTDFDFNSLWN